MAESKYATVFSSAVFCSLWAKVYGVMWSPIGPISDLGAIYSYGTRLALRKYDLSPQGLYWGGNQENIDLSRCFLNEVTQICHQWNCLRLNWNFRYDARVALEQALVRLGPSNCVVTELDTHVLDLNGESFDHLIQSQVKAVTRRQIRMGLNAGLKIREIKTQLDLNQHDHICKLWAVEKGINSKPSSLIPKLATEMESSTLFLGAFIQEKLLAAIFIFRDKHEWFYWHGVRDIYADKYFATDVLLAYAIENACENNVRFFNMGGSNGIKTLEFFKERWGAIRQPRWSLAWVNPYWGRLFNIWNKIR